MALLDIYLIHLFTRTKLGAATLGLFAAIAFYVFDDDMITALSLSFLMSAIFAGIAILLSRQPPERRNPAASNAVYWSIVFWGSMALFSISLIGQANRDGVERAVRKAEAEAASVPPVIPPASYALKEIGTEQLPDDHVPADQPLAAKTPESPAIKPSLSFDDVEIDTTVDEVKPDHFGSVQ